MSRPLYRRVAKLEAISRPPTRIVFEYVYAFLIEYQTFKAQGRERT